MLKNCSSSSVAAAAIGPCNSRDTILLAPTAFVVASAIEVEVRPASISKNNDNRGAEKAPNLRRSTGMAVGHDVREKTGYRQCELINRYGTIKTAGSVVRRHERNGRVVRSD